MREYWWVGILGWILLDITGSRLSPRAIKGTWRSEETPLGKVISFLGYSSVLASHIVFVVTFLLLLRSDGFFAVVGCSGAVAVGDRSAVSMGYFTHKRERRNPQ